MVTSIARQSVIIKCNMKTSVLLGNYEFYYASGLFLHLCGKEVEDTIRPQELEACVKNEIPKFQKNVDEKADYLVKMLENYVVLDEYDEQMKELLQWGLTEKNIWQM